MQNGNEGQNQNKLEKLSRYYVPDFLRVIGLATALASQGNVLFLILGITSAVGGFAISVFFILDLINSPASAPKDLSLVPRTWLRILFTLGLSFVLAAAWTALPGVGGGLFSFGTLPSILTMALGGVVALGSLGSIGYSLLTRRNRVVPARAVVAEHPELRGLDRRRDSDWGFAPLPPEYEPARLALAVDLAQAQPELEPQPIPIPLFAPASLPLDQQPPAERPLPLPPERGERAAQPPPMNNQSLQREEQNRPWIMLYSVKSKNRP